MVFVQVIPTPSGLHKPPRPPHLVYIIIKEAQLSDRFEEGACLTSAHDRPDGDKQRHGVSLPGVLCQITPQERKHQVRGIKPSVRWVDSHNLTSEGCSSGGRTRSFTSVVT